MTVAALLRSSNHPRYSLAVGLGRASTCTLRTDRHALSLGSTQDFSVVQGACGPTPLADRAQRPLREGDAQCPHRYTGTRLKLGAAGPTTGPSRCSRGRLVIRRRFTPIKSRRWSQSLRVDDFLGELSGNFRLSEGDVADVYPHTQSSDEACIASTRWAP
jgi:hypothetical protein